MRKIDVTGERFGHLVAIRLIPKTKKERRKWLCKCDCGSEVIVVQGKLRGRFTKSCGCLNQERWKKQLATPNLTDKPEYWIWGAMVARCENTKNPYYKNYGGRGITVDQRWLGRGGFSNFYLDLGPRPTKNHTLERKENDKGYSPDNCVWATRAEQSRNTRRTRFLEFQGRRMPLKDWADELGIKPTTLFQRLTRSKWSVEKALTSPVKKS